MSNDSKENEMEKAIDDALKRATEFISTGNNLPLDEIKTSLLLQKAIGSIMSKNWRKRNAQGHFIKMFVHLPDYISLGILKTTHEMFITTELTSLNDKEKQLTDFLNVNTVKEYSTSKENQLVSLPADYEDIIKDDGVGAYIIKDNKIVKEHGYLYRIGYDKVKNAMVFKVELQKAGYYRLELQEDGSYDFDKAHGLSSVKVFT